MDRVVRVGNPNIARAAAPLSFWRRHGRTMLGVTIGALLIHDVFGAHGFLAMRRTQIEIEKLRQEIAQITAENQELEKHVKALKSEPKLIERIAREEMGFARPGERIFRLQGNEKK